MCFSFQYFGLMEQPGSPDLYASSGSETEPQSEASPAPIRAIVQETEASTSRSGFVDPYSATQEPSCYEVFGQEFSQDSSQSQYIELETDTEGKQSGFELTPEQSSAEPYSHHCFFCCEVVNF